MADYTQIKELMIDDVTMGMEEGLGSGISATKTITNFPTSWSWTEGASITLPPGVWVLRAQANFPNATTTGTNLFGIAIRTASGDSFHNTFANGDQRNSNIFTMGVVVPQTNIVFKVVAVSARPMTGNQVYTSIGAYKLLKI